MSKCSVRMTSKSNERYWTLLRPKYCVDPGAGMARTKAMNMRSPLFFIGNHPIGPAQVQPAVFTLRAHAPAHRPIISLIDRTPAPLDGRHRSEERRVGKEYRSRW